MYLYKAQFCHSNAEMENKSLAKENWSQHLVLALPWLHFMADFVLPSFGEYGAFYLLFNKCVDYKCNPCEVYF